MARTTRSKAPVKTPAAAVPAAAAASPEVVFEEPVLSSSEEAPSEEEAETTESTELDLSPIQPALDAAHAGKDPTTGEVSLALLSDVKAGYRKLNTKSQKSIKASSQEAIKQAMLDSEIPTARCWLDIKNSLVGGKLSSGEPSTPKAPKNPTPTYVQAVVAVRLAYSALLSELKPAKLDDDVNDQIEARVSDLMDDMIEFTSQPVEEKEYAPEVLKAARFAKMRLTKTAESGNSGTRAKSRNLGAHILEALGSQTGKFMSLSDIQGFHSDEYDGAKPSGGAILNRLFPPSGKECTLPNVLVGTQDGKRGATLVV